MTNEQEIPNNEKESTAFIIFGVTGDLTRRKLLPAIYELAVTGQLAENFHIIGFARRDWTDEVLVQNLVDGVNQFAHRQPVDTDALQKVLQGRQIYLLGIRKTGWI